MFIRRVRLELMEKTNKQGRRFFSFSLKYVLQLLLTNYYVYFYGQATRNRINLLSDVFTSVNQNNFCQNYLSQATFMKVL